MGCDTGKKTKFNAWLITDYDLPWHQAYVLDDGIKSFMVQKSDCRCVDTDEPVEGKCYEWEMEEVPWR